MAILLLSHVGKMDITFKVFKLQNNESNTVDKSGFQQLNKNIKNLHQKHKKYTC